MLQQHLHAPLAKLQALTSQSSTFQTLVGAADAAAALASIPMYMGLDADTGGLDETLTDPMPRVSLYLHSYQWRKSTSSGGPTRTGLVWMPEFTIPNGTARADEGPYFMQLVEAILDEMKEASLTAGELNVVDVSMPTPPLRCDPTQNNGRLFWFMALLVEVSG